MRRGFLYFGSILFLFSSSAAKAQVAFKDIDVQHYKFAIALNDANDNIKGKAEVTIKFTGNVNEPELNLVKKNSTGKGMLVSSVDENGKALKFVQDSDVVHILSPAKNNTTHTYIINYSGIPADGLIISTNKHGHRTFFGDNWPNRAHNWLPCADYPSDKATVEFIVTAPDHYQVVSNGLKIQEKKLPNHIKLTHWKENEPLAPKLMVIGVADFAIQQSGTVNGVPVYTYVFPEDKVNGFKNYAYAPDILKFYDAKIGLYDYEKLANVQSKTIYGGMENASAIFYYEESTDAGRAVEELEAHEIGHQWFGDAVTEKNWKNLWLSEGFATYMTNCYLENKYGIDTLKKREAFDRNKVIKFERRHYAPVVDTAVKGNYVQLLNANSYEKGSWTLHMLRRKIGDEAFWKGLRTYYAQYKNKNANTADLEQVMEQTSGQDLHTFFSQWIYNAGHPELSLVWSYDADKKSIGFTITQKQSNLYTFPLQLSIDGKLYTIDVKNKETIVSYASNAKPVVIVADPNVDLLAEFEVMEK
ncbi:M1 family metallopeptidase [Mucilaginibacter sp.]